MSVEWPGLSVWRPDEPIGFTVLPQVPGLCEHRWEVRVTEVYTADVPLPGMGDVGQYPTEVIHWRECVDCGEQEDLDEEPWG